MDTHQNLHPRMRTLIRIHRSICLGMRYLHFPIFPSTSYGKFATLRSSFFSIIAISPESHEEPQVPQNAVKMGKKIRLAVTISITTSLYDREPTVALSFYFPGISSYPPAFNTMFHWSISPSIWYLINFLYSLCKSESLKWHPA